MLLFYWLAFLRIHEYQKNLKPNEGLGAEEVCNVARD